MASRRVLHYSPREEDPVHCSISCYTLSHLRLRSVAPALPCSMALLWLVATGCPVFAAPKYGSTRSLMPTKQGQPAAVRSTRSGTRPPRPAPGRAPSVPRPSQPAPRPAPYVPPQQSSEVPAAVTLPAPPPLPLGFELKPLTVEEACAVALVHQASLAQARGAEKTAHGRATQAAAALLPSLTVSTSYSEAVAQSSSGSAAVGAAALGGGAAQGNSAAAGAAGVANLAALQAFAGYQTFATVRQLVFDFNHTRDVVRQARAAEHAAQALTLKAQSDLLYNVKSQLYNLLQARQALAVQEANFRNRQEHLGLARSRFKAGVGLPVDVLRAQAAVSEAVLAVNQAQNNLSVVRVNLALALGLDPRTPLEVAESHEQAAELEALLATDVSALFERALRQRPEMAQAQASVEAGSHGVQAARSGNAPVLSATMTYFSRGQEIIPKSHTLLAGAQVSWTPLDSGLTHGRVLEAQGNLEQAQAAFVTARQGVLADVATSYLNLKTAQQRLVTAGEEVVSAAESARLAEGRYRSGLGQFLDVLDAQAALLTAETNQVTARATLDQAWAALQRALGEGLRRPPSSGGQPVQAGGTGKERPGH